MLELRSGLPRRLTQMGSPLSFIVVVEEIFCLTPCGFGWKTGQLANLKNHLLRARPIGANSFAVLRTLRLGIRTIAIAALVGLAVAVEVAFLIPAEYTSVASFIPPNATNTSGAGALAGQLSQLSGLGSGSILGGMKSPGDLYVGILKSRSIRSDLVKRFDLQRVYHVRRESTAEEKLSAHTKFEVDTKTSIVTLSVTDTSPARAHDMANAYLEALRETNGRLALSESSQRRLFFEQISIKEKNDLEDAEVELKKTEEQSGLIAPVGQTTMEIETIAQTRAEISLRQVELSALRDSATEQTEPRRRSSAKQRSPILGGSCLDWRAVTKRPQVGRFRLLRSRNWNSSMYAKSAK